MNNPNQHIPDNLIERLSTRWNEMTSAALTMDNDWLANPDAEEAAWAIAQLVAWPKRIDEDRTTNDRFLRMSVAALALRQQAALESAQREIAELRRAGDELADKLWVLRCESGDELSRNAAERACDEWDAFNKQESLG